MDAVTAAGGHRYIFVCVYMCMCVCVCVCDLFKASQGHFKVYAQSPVNGQWNTFDDDRVSPMTFKTQEIRSRSAYLLLYKLVRIMFVFFILNSVFHFTFYILVHCQYLISCIYALKRCSYKRNNKRYNL